MNRYWIVAGILAASAMFSCSAEASSAPNALTQNGFNLNALTQNALTPTAMASQAMDATGQAGSAIGQLNGVVILGLTPTAQTPR